MTLADILTSSPQPSVTLKTTNSDVIDERSQKGQFGWFTLGMVHIPLIYRNNEEYCSVRMAEQGALNCYLKFLNKDIDNCVNVKSSYVTSAEANLLNQINFIHCDGQFGRDHFANQLLIKVNDVKEFYDFLRICYGKLIGKEADCDKRLGFVIINKESVVPYAVSNGRKYVPLFYFEGEIDQLKLKSYKLEGWDLSYLKFCCKIQGIRNQLFAHDTCSVIDLADIKQYFPPETTFDEYWPNNSGTAQLLVPSRNQLVCGEWTRRPPAPLIVPAHKQNALQKNSAYPPPKMSCRTYPTIQYMSMS
ncbi:uncharacterized protein [Onthophagus taurus]|uniref:uncharacterized protein n=1 Tax=Onthophagus taurus TaxID=166361 RepID=UPI000C20A642|nr:uncharacterized protein LOC111426775 [Onthophagus taurus]